MNSVRSTTGWSSVSSQITRKVRPTTATTPRTQITFELNQSRSLPLSSITCRAPTPSTSATRPVTSIGERAVGASRRRSSVHVVNAANRPMGALM